MDLKKYRGEGGCSPRDNPRGVLEKPGNKFVIKKNQASDLCFELRLEIIDKKSQNKILHSWIIPKNIPLEPETKHLAIKIKNKPLNYPNSDKISKTTNIWDKGRWGLMKGEVENGFISFNLFGKIAKSRYTLQKIENQKNKGNKNHWMIWKVINY